MADRRPTLIVLGSGFASFSLVKTIDVERYEVVVISPRNHFLFSPLLPSTTVGTVEFRSIIEPIRTARRNIRFYQARCVRIDPEAKVVHCEGAFRGSPFELAYDMLVVGVGAVSNTYGVPGVERHAFFLKELSDARGIRQKIIECFERASKPARPLDQVKALLHFIIVGGGPTGVEFAAEMHDFVKQDLGKWFPDLKEHVRITILEARGEILSNFDARLGSYAIEHFGRTHVEVRTHSLVQEVLEDEVVLQTHERIPCGLVVWSTGIGASDLVRSLDVRRDSLGRIVVDESFGVPGMEGVYAAGDCAAIEGEDHPPTAQVAQQQGTYLAKWLNRRVRERSTKPFEYRHMGMLAYIGERRALADLKNVKGRGFATWLFWRSAYLSKLVSTKNKMLVLGGWVRTFLFGRDISRF